MNGPKRGILASGFFLVLALATSDARAATRPSALPSPTSTPALITVLPSPIPTISPDESRTLQKEFKKAQTSELAALKHRQDLELKELKSSQAARQKEFENHEKDARHDFFRDHTRGSDRRVYIKEFLDRRRVMLDLFKDETSRRKQEQEARRESVKHEQAQRLKDFEAALQRKERPSLALWPAH